MTRPPSIPQRTQEEEHFFRVNQELINEYRARLDEERRLQEKEQSRHLHWMKCPKCGGDLQTNSVAGITAEQCRDCAGVFFNQGEIELLLKSRDSESFLDSLRVRMEQAVNDREEWQIPSH